MITIQEDTKLKEGIREAIKKAAILSKSVLVSEVQKISRMDALSFFAAGRGLFFGERFFWKDATDETLMVGLGLCDKIQMARPTNRFFLVEKEWNDMLEHAIIINPFNESAIGPTMFGGFSFDPFKNKTALWSNFSDSQFHIPTFMYSEKNGQAYLTTNVICHKEDDDSLAEKLEAERKKVLATLTIKSNYKQNDLIHERERNSEQWMKTVRSIVEELKRSSMKKVVLARESRLTYKDPIQVEQVVERLLEQQRNSFIFTFESKGDCFIGATPERLVKKDGQQMFTTCLAGSIPRGRTKENDQRLGEMLLTDQKNLVEHKYVVEMIKGAVGELCEEVHLPEQPQLMKMRDIQHLYTPVVGKTKESTSLLLLVERLHPTPALGGLPKEEAVVKIREVEELERGLYGAPLGWMDYNGNGDFAVSIRSGLIQGNEASIFAGCGVVEDSDAASEYEETKVKFRPMLSALGGQKQ